MRESVIIRTDDGGFPFDVEYITLDEVADLDRVFVDSWYTCVRETVDFLYGNILPRVCLSCGQYFGAFDLHHAISSRQDVRGWRHTAGPYDYKTVKLLLITNVLNCIPLHNDCNVNHPPTREAAWAHQERLYGENMLNRWYYTLPWKNGPPRLF